MRNQIYSAPQCIGSQHVHVCDECMLAASISDIVSFVNYYNFKTSTKALQRYLGRFVLIVLVNVK